jgi:peptidoglycan/xylan/chitin deacetylase (PgdA/CDA1 family)
VKYEKIRTIGKILRGLQTHRLNAVLSPRTYIRVTYTHEVLSEHERNFESLVSYLAKTHEPLTPARFFRIIKQEEPLTGRHVLMTFDDGLMSSYRAIKTTLSKFNIKAIVFVPTQILELKSPSEMKRFAWRNLGFREGEPPDSLREEAYLMMGTRELLDLKKDGHAVFPHTHTHKRLIEVCDNKTVEEEIIRPRKILESLMQEPMNAFAFPVGTERVVSEFCFPYLKHEYEFCFSALAGKNTAATDPHLLHRDPMNANYAIDHVRNMEEGVFDLYYRHKLNRLKRAFSGH